VNITQKVTELHLPEKQFVVVGSGALVIRNLIDNGDDIDLAVSVEVYESLKSQGWTEEPGHGGKPVLRHEIYDVGIGYGEWSLEELLEDTFVVDGVPFMSLEKVLLWKKSAGRDKDLAHIRLIEEYLKTIL
jgi:hypothetical protein